MTSTLITQRSYLELVQAAMNELGLPEPTQVVSGGDDYSRQILALSNREAAEFYKMGKRRGGWQVLQQEYTFTTSAITGLSGTITSGSAVVTGISSTAGIVAGTWTVSATGLPYQCYVVSVDSSTQITLDQVATSSGTVSLTVGQAGYDIPNDFSYFVSQTIWDGNFRWQLLGPISPQERNVLRWGISPVGPRRRFWVRENKLWLDPTPTTSGQLVAYDYYSKAPIYGVAGTGEYQQRWEADTDVYRLDEECFILGLKWRYRAAKGLDYSQEKRDYDVACEQAMARDGGNRVLPMNAQSPRDIHLLNEGNIPDTGFGQ